MAEVDGQVEQVELTDVVAGDGVEQHGLRVLVGYVPYHERRARVGSRRHARDGHLVSLGLG